MFALAPLERIPSQVNLKCDPERAIALREDYDGVIMPRYHMSKIHWNTLFLEHLRTDLIEELIDHSYELIVAKFPKKIREQFEKL